MKRLLILLTALLFCGLASSQTVLKEATHGLLPGYPNPMILTEVADPGQGGKDVVWDFSAIPQKGPFRGEVVEPSVLNPAIAFMGANSCLVENHLRAFMVTSKNELRVLGLTVPASGMERTYSEPIVKMRYPFAYGDSHTSESAAVETYGQQARFDMHLVNNINADGEGTLILPGVTLKGALRVLTTQTLTYHYGSSPSTMVVETYRWYVPSHRYPVLSLIFQRSSNGELRPLQAAYNPVVVAEEVKAREADKSQKVAPLDGGIVTSMKVAPNPVSSELRVRYEVSKASRVIVALYNMQGYLVETLFQGQVEAGTYSVERQVSSLPAGVYAVRVEAAGGSMTELVVKQ